MRNLPHALFRAAQVRELDRQAIRTAAIDGYGLMQRAGEAAWRLLQEQWPQARRLVVLCGAGNNAGDGYVVARMAARAGLAVTVVSLIDPGQLAGEAARAYDDWRAAGGSTAAFDDSLLQQADVLVDALLGTGLTRALEGHWAAAVHAMNDNAAPVLALDIPSGLSADTGAVLGVAVHAAATISFIGLKQGLFTGEGPDCVGRIHFDDLQVPAEIYLQAHPSAVRIGTAILSRLLPPRPRTQHKGRCGHVLVVGGDYGMAGAARLAGEAAARTGAGLVSIATRPEHAAATAAAVPELMCHGVAHARELAPLLQRADVVAVGPGLGQHTWGRELLGAVLESNLPLVVDADALNLLAQEPLQRGNWILTPHPGEAARLLRVDTNTVQSDRFAALDSLVDAFAATVVLKGAGSLTRSAGGKTYVCDAGNPGMASGGMGDVLSGVLAALVGQGLDLEDAARAGVYLHAAAADRAAAQGERGLMASDLMPALRFLANPQGAQTR